MHSSSGDVVADLFGRGGWVARAAVDRQRRAVSLESTPLTRMLAEVVLRPPDVRHLDAAFQGMAASPRRESSLKVSLGDLYATRCATCGRTLVVDEIIWALDDGVDPATADPRPRSRSPSTTAARSAATSAAVRSSARARSMTTTSRGSPPTSGSRRCAPPCAAGSRRSMAPSRSSTSCWPSTRRASSSGSWRSSTASRATSAPPRSWPRSGWRSSTRSCRPAASRRRPGGSPTCASTAATSASRAATQWRERNPWLAFEDAVRLVRGFVQRLEGGALGPLQARLGEDLRSLGEGTATAVLALSSPSGLRVLHDEPSAPGRGAPAPRIRLVLGQPPVRPGLERLGIAYHATSWVLGREAASLLPIDALAGSSLRAPWSWQAATIGRALEAAAPAMARDGRAVLLVDSGPEGLAAAVLGGASAGYRLVSARLADGDDEVGGSVEFLPPGAARPPGAADAGQRVAADRSRAAPATRTWSPGRASSPPRALRPATVLGRGGGPDRDRHGRRDAPCPRRAGPLRAALRRDPRRARSGRPAPPSRDRGARTRPGRRAPDRRRRARPGRSRDRRRGRPTDRPPGPGRDPRRATDAAAVPIERSGRRRISAPARCAVASAGEAVARPGRSTARARPRRDGPARQRAARGDRARPLVARPTRRTARRPRSRSPTASSGPSSASSRPPARCPRRRSSSGSRRCSPATTCPTRPSSGPASRATGAWPARRTASSPATTCSRRSQEHTDLLGGPRRRAATGWACASGWPGASRPAGRTARCSATGSTSASSRPTSAAISRPAEDLAEVDCIWYVRGKVALLFEVEWTAMLGEPLLRRHARIPPDDRSCASSSSPRSGPSSSATSSSARRCCARPSRTAACNIIKSDHLRRFLDVEKPDLADLEPLPRTRSGDRAERRADAAVRRLNGPRPAIRGDVTALH